MVPREQHASKLILLEFNELCPPLLTRWMAEGRLPNFQKLHSRSDVFITKADAEPPALEPWIQWYSLHTGLPYSEHQVFRLTEGPRAGHEDIWTILRDAGLKVMNFSSMNARGFAGGDDVFLADPWCKTEAAHPAELSAFHDFVLAMVQEYTNPDAPSKTKLAARFISFMAQRGLSLATVQKTVSQLLSEKTNDTKLSYRRAFIMDAFATDVFEWYWRRRQPNFATFFLNSTAHMQHAYWRHMEPETFSVHPGEQATALYGSAIREGYENMDKIVGRVLALAEKNGARLAFATALSQQPYLDAEGSGGRKYYRPRDVGALLKTLGIEAVSIEPVMTHQYVLRFADEGQKERARQVLSSATRASPDDAKPLFRWDEAAGGEGLIFDCEARVEVDADTGITMAGEAGRFGDWFYPIDQSKSGKHHPDGCFWVEAAHHHVHAEPVSILDVLPTLLAQFGVERAAEPHGRILRAA